MNKFKPVITTFALATTLLCSFSTWALNLRASVTKTTVSKDEVIQLKITADEKLDSDSINLDVLSDDFYVSRPSFGSSVNIINGKRSDSSIWTVAIAPQKIGTLTIPSFKVNNAATAPITLNVSMNAQAPSSDDILEVRTKLDKKELYPNESTVFNARIIVKVDPRRLQNVNLTKPSAPGMQLQPLADPKQSQAVLNGVEVLVIDQSFRVTANNSGDFTIQAPTLTGLVNYGNGRGNSHIVTLSGQSKQVPIKVLPIPEDYHGPWLPTSNLQLSQHWQLDNQQSVTNQSVTIDAGDSITRTITLTAADLTSEQLPNLSISSPNAFRVYSDKPSFTPNDDGSVTMTTKQVLIAKKSGEYALPSVKVQWWNSQTKQPKISEVSGLNVTVNPGDTTEKAQLPQPPITETKDPLPPQHKDNGYWPILTAVFAILWIISTILWIRATQRNATQNTQTKPPKNKAATTNLKEQLICAIKNRDVIKAQTIFDAWIKNAAISDVDSNKIRKQIKDMSQALVGKSSTPWEHTELISSIKNVKNQNHKQHDDLARL
ncbi:BatD family protein [Vibrio rarus]|uniref:BatD family protein n=1 Tax=Vibrio rarus TaxID=413403 RepID=UPI0021C28233|nr:BatD family protein [Vibrio rarus]